MCKRIKDILWPLNIFGKKVRSIKYKLPDGDESVTLNIVFDGDRLQVNYTHIIRPAEYRGVKKIPKSITFTDGDTLPVGVLRGRIGMAYNYVGSMNADDPAYDVIYFKCTNVTSLVVNGQQLI